MNWRKMATTHLAAHARVSLADAIGAAEQAPNGGVAVAAGMAWGATNSDNDVHAYNVMVLHGDGTTHRIAVDSETGQVISDPGALADWP
jgi:hypothetical protein